MPYKKFKYDDVVFIFSYRDINEILIEHDR